MLAANDNAPLPDWGDDSFEAVSARTAMLLSRIPRSPGYGI